MSSVEICIQHAVVKQQSPQQMVNADDSHKMSSLIFLEYKTNRILSATILNGSEYASFIQK